MMMMSRLGLVGDERERHIAPLLTHSCRLFALTIQRHYSRLALDRHTMMMIIIVDHKHMKYDDDKVVVVATIEEESGQ